jgi:hypothetical protein
VPVIPTPLRLFRRAPLLGAMLLLVPGLVLAGAMTNSALAATPTTVNLGTAASASVLAGAGVTNSGSTILPSDLDTYPSSAITGFPPGLVIAPGTEHAGDAVAQQAQSDLTIAYNSAAAAPKTADVTGVDLGGHTLTEGVYNASSSLALTGQLTLNGGPSSVFIFQAGTTLVTASNSSILLTGGALACNVFWQVGSSATVGADTTFVGNILASMSISLDTGATVQGRALARTGSVTLLSNVFTNPGCNTTTPPTTAPPTTAPPTTTVPSSTGTGSSGGGSSTGGFSGSGSSGSGTSGSGTSGSGASGSGASAGTAGSGSGSSLFTGSGTSTGTGVSPGAATGISGAGGATLIGSAASGSGPLAETGTDVLPLVETAATLLFAGMGLVFLERLRRRRLNGHRLND